MPGNFYIDPRTGQLKVEEELDFEDPDNPEQDSTKSLSHVNVADSSAAPPSDPDDPMGTDTVIAVTITVAQC